uniref:Uncharacterized protein n=1 Tax=Rhodnius prolixus TaxID=13249 RepID=T1HAI9_RHOPR
MELRTPVLLLALLGACSGSIPCPQACRCDRKSFSGAIARCSELDPDVQRFPLDITRLVVENYHGERDLALTDRMFSDMGLERVTVIKIVNSTLRDIQVSAFHGLHNLQEVDFSHNRLILIHPDTFKNNKNLARVVLKGNPLQLTQVLEQKDHHFLNSESLRELDLSHCRLTQIAPKTFSNLRGLELLDLSGNDLTEIKADTLANLESLEDLYLAYNSISKIDPNAFNDIDDMIKLSLRGNPIKTLEGIEVPGLAELDISECDLEILAGASFRGFLDLETLNLSRNSIRDIDPEAFYNLLNLKYLDLSFNMIRGPLDDSLFSLNQKLETISLAGNKELKVFKELHSFISMEKLEQLDISKNPIQCTSDFSHVMQWLIVNRVMPNKGDGSRPANLGFIDNNIEWDEVLKEVCPINAPTTKSQLPANTLPEEKSQKSFPHSTLFKNTEKRRNSTKKLPINIEEPLSFRGPEEITKIEPIGDPPLVWPMVLIWISILSILIALGNLMALLIYRSRRQYRVLSYKPHFASPLETQFPARRIGGRSPYKKLYEECSVPAPVHDHKIKIVTFLENAFHKNNSKV